MAAKYKLRSAMRRAKSNYDTKLEKEITTSDTFHLELLNMTNYKNKSTPTSDSDNKLPDTQHFLWEV